MEPRDWSIRDGRADEFDEVMALIAKAYGEFGTDVTDDFAEAFLEDARKVQSPSDESQTIVAERRGRLVGCVSLYLNGGAYADGWPPEWPAVRLLAVDPQERGKGIAAALMAECIGRARESGAVKLGLHTTPFMGTARRMYERMGFVREPAIDYQYAPELKVMGYLLPL